MGSQRGEEIVNSMERKFGHLAIPNLLRWLAIFQVLTFGLSLLSPPLVEWMTFESNKIFSGEVWRVFSWVFLPVSYNLLIVIIAAMFLFFISDSIENAWGSFKVNIFVLSSFFLVAGLCLVLPQYAQNNGLMRMASFSCYFLAFCSLFPNQVIHLMMVIPIKAKWLGWANLAILIASISNSYSLGFSILITLVGLLPFLLVFLPTFIADMKNSSETAMRRQKFQSDVDSATGDTFHLCSKCAATEVSDPEKEFRVTSSGEEYCIECLDKAS